MGKGVNSLAIEIDTVLSLSAYISRCLALKGKGGGKKQYNSIRSVTSH